MKRHLPPVTYAPDGWYEADIDDLLAEFGAAFAQADVKAKPSSRLVDQRGEHRRRRRITRQTVNAAVRGAAPLRQDHQEAA